MKHLKIILLATFAVIVVGCASNQVGITKHTGFTELPFPSNAYASGQIVEVYSSPRKVEITFDPQIPWDQATTSEGWDISSSETSNIKSKFSTEISKILELSAGYTSDQSVQVEFTDTKTRLVPKNRIFSAVNEAISTDESLRKQLEIYLDDGTHFDVITQTLSATISFKVVNSSNQEVSVDSEIIEKLNADFNIDFSKQDGSNKVISGTNLVVGVHYDPKMIDLLVK